MKDEESIEWDPKGDIEWEIRDDGTSGYKGWDEYGEQQELRNPIVIGGKEGRKLCSPKLEEFIENGIQHPPRKKEKQESWNVYDDLVTMDGSPFLAILCRIKFDGNRIKLLGRNSGKNELFLTENRTVLWSRPGIYISKQGKVGSATTTDRTWYVGEGKNLGQRIQPKARKEYVFSDGSEVTIIVKKDGKVKDDYFFFSEFRTTAERKVSEIIEGIDDAVCNHKATWCLMPEGGKPQLEKLKDFVEHLKQSGKLCSN